LYRNETSLYLLLYHGIQPWFVEKEIMVCAAYFVGRLPDQYISDKLYCGNHRKSSQLV